jgi:WD40 repeat protein
MSLLGHLFGLFLLLAVLFACTSTPGWVELSRPAQTAPSAPGSVVRPTEQISAPPTGLPQAAITYADHLSPAPRMNVPRAAHTATLLSNGKVLIAGGFRQEGTSEISIASAELYDPITNTFIPLADLNEARNGHTATLLPDGQVLIVGGWGLSGRIPTAELYDPQTGKFSYTASLAAPRAGMTATLLPNGKVLIAGGESARNTPQLAAEIYDPASNTFAQTGPLNSGRFAHTATLLAEGSVLLIGGTSGGNTVLASAELYNPATGKFTLTGSLNAVRYKHAAVLLPSGNVLVMGGSDQNDWQGKYASAEMYNVQTGSFTKIAPLNRERFKLADAAVLLANGNVLIGGGHRQLEIFDVTEQRFILSQKLETDYYFSVLTLLQNGTVLITGGYDSRIQPTNQAWFYY